MYDGRVSGYDIHSRTIGTDYGGNEMSRTKEELEKEINDRLFYFYGQTDGTFDFPNSAEGDLLKLVNEYMMKPNLKKVVYK
jgi:hypothetical protein